jgi:hypothetical protein
MKYNAIILYFCVVRILLCMSSAFQSSAIACIPSLADSTILQRTFTMSDQLTKANFPELPLALHLALANMEPLSSTIRGTSHGKVLRMRSLR